jgi:transposase
MAMIVEQKKEVLGGNSSEQSAASTVKTNTIIIDKTEYETVTAERLKVQELQKAITELKSENAELILQVVALEEKIALLLYKRFVRSSEKYEDDKQASLFNEDEAVKPEPVDETACDSEIPVKEHTRNKPGRKPIPENLPRKIIMNDLRDEEKHCVCGKELINIGEDTAERLVIIPQQVYVERTVTPKYVCPCCGKAKGDEDAPSNIRTAPLPPVLLPGSIASAALLAYIFIAKFCDGLPYYRLEKQFERIGVSISRQDMVNWQVAVFERLTLLFQLMMEQLKSGNVLRMDETTVQVMGEEDRKDTQKSYIWLARGGPPDKTVIILKYRPTRASVNIDEFVEGFAGFLQTDGYEGYDCALKRHRGIIHVGCFAHVRRKFFEAQKAGSQAKSASIGLKYIQKLYAIETELRIKDLCDADFVAQRKAQTKPVLDDFKEWLDKVFIRAKAETLLQKAVNYAHNQWDKLIEYLNDAELTPDNNMSENAIRPFVIGRKNWLFYQSPAGAASACGMYSLIESAKCNGLEPAAYLTFLFEKAPLAVTPANWTALLPWNVTLA